MTPAWRIRPAGVADVPRLRDWAVAMARETEDKALDPATVEAGIRAVLEEPRRGAYFVAEREGVPGGTLMLTYEWSDWRNGDWWWIQSVYVDPACRRQGCYAALYRHVSEAAKATPGVCGLRLYVEHHNAAAQRTYESLGMADAGYRMYEAPTR
ncbi:MAG: GNAT family N-acetyltransferase [Arenimonas sp. SCN 70-307]|uniref:GNAT family N-acetyltransferase n=1 Tax=Arenimonas sp. SCN 70-307 TaxID=1660089 RepID=UPI00086AFCAF|nr:GNAT family N-acetyltransferase [Arenimonas sp. SCN 70-307]ODS64377.1 MAG: GNAT family N-acetyltransferase [Arenimonas sp. SCN 70-307]